MVPSFLQLFWQIPISRASQSYLFWYVELLLSILKFCNCTFIHAMPLLECLTPQVSMSLNLKISKYISFPCSLAHWTRPHCGSWNDPINQLDSFYCLLQTGAKACHSSVFLETSLKNLVSTVDPETALWFNSSISQPHTVTILPLQGLTQGFSRSPPRDLEKSCLSIHMITACHLQTLKWTCIPAPHQVTGDNPFTQKQERIHTG